MNLLRSSLADRLVTMLRVRLHRARTAPSRGASALEWVIILAVVSVVALALGALVLSLSS